MPDRVRTSVCLVVSAVVCIVASARTVSAGTAAAQACAVVVAYPLDLHDGDVVGAVMPLQVSVSSSCQLQSVVATVPGLSAPLSLSDGYWRADVPMASVPRGGFTLTITATDVFGTIGTRTLSLIKDAKPIVTVTAPMGTVLAHPTTHVTATCQDDDPAGCYWLRVVIIQPASGSPLFVAKSSIDNDISFWPFQGPWTVTIEGRDTRGQITWVTRKIYIEPSPRLTQTFAAPGDVIADGATRALFTDANGQPCIIDKATGAITVMLGGGPYDTHGVLTPLGAMFESGPPTGTSGVTRLYEWRSGTLLTLGRPNSGWRAAGNYAIWSGSLNDTLGDALFLRDLAADSTVQIEDHAGNTENDVSANGDVVYWKGGQIWRYRAGVKTALTTYSSSYSAVYPVTDGINVAYRRKDSSQTLSTWLITASGEEALDPAASDTTFSSGYAVSGGWTAFTKRAADGSRNLWLRAPDGTRTQVTFFGGSVTIKALNGDGRVAVQFNNRTYLVTPGAAPVEVGYGWPRVFWRDGDLYLIVGRWVMRVQLPGAATYTGDFDGDAKADLTRYGADGTWLITTSATNYTASTPVTLGGDGDTPVPGDYDGDGRVDPAVYRAATGDWTALTSSSGYATPFNLHWGGPGYVAVPGDYDGDRKTDPAIYQRSTGWWFILKSSSNYIDSIPINWGGPGYTAIGGQDFDADGTTDLVVYRRATGMWHVLLSSTNFTTTISVHWGGPGLALVPGDYDADGKADFATYERATGWWRILKSTSAYTTTLDVNWGGFGYVPVPADYDGDGKIDPATFVIGTGNWHVLKSTSSYTSSFTIAGELTAGLPGTSAITLGDTDPVRAGDADGDAASDITVYNPTNGVWYTLTSTSNYADAINTPWGGAGYTPVPGDYDGDGKADRAVYQSATGWWFVLLSGAEFTTSVARNLGGPGWTPVPGDYDGDGRTDFVACNTSSGQWYGLLSGTGYTTTVNVMLGGPGFTAVPGDYDGDGRGDLGVYESATGTWTVRLAASNFAGGFSKIAGSGGDVPVAGDYDGDGRSDFVVYNTSSGVWHGLKSGANYATTFSIGWGGTGYAPVKGDYDGDGRADLAVYHEASGVWSILLSGASYSTTISKNWGGAGYSAVPQYP